VYGLGSGGSRSVQIVCFGGGMRSNECPYSLQ